MHSRKIQSAVADIISLDDDIVTTSEPLAPSTVNPPPLAPLNLFEKFNSAGKLMSDWLLPEENVVARPISEDLAAKLRQRQDSMTLPSSALPMKDTPAEVVEAAAPSRLEANGFDGGEFFLFGPRKLSEKQAATSKLNISDLQAVVSINNNKGFDGRTASIHLSSSGGKAGKSSQRSVPLWSVERFEKAGGYCETNALVALHEEILDLVDYLSPGQAEVSMRRHIEMQISEFAKKLWPQCNPCVYGSMATHLLLPLSDLDMSILNVPVSTEDALQALSREIGAAGLCTTAFPQLILKTKVPLLKFTHKGSLLDVDVSINAGDGKVNSDIVKSMLGQYPEAKPLVIVVKYFLQQREMHEPYHGGLGSFATTLLVISFLQHHPIYTTRPHERAVTGLGKLLVDFFRYYGCCFNYHRCGISLDNGGFYFVRKQQSVVDGGRPQNQVIIEDPGNKANNAASSLRQFPVIASTFAHAYCALTARFPLPEDGSEMSPDSDEILLRPTLLSRILHIDGDSVARRRCIIEAFEIFESDPVNAVMLERILAYRRDEDSPMLRTYSLPDFPTPSLPSAAPPVNPVAPMVATQPKKKPEPRRGDIETTPSATSSPTVGGSPSFTQQKKRDRDVSDEPRDFYDEAPRQPNRRKYTTPNPNL